MRQEVLIVLIAIAAAFVACFMIYKWLFTPRQHSVVKNSVKRSKQVDKTISYRENQKVIQMKISFTNFFSKMPIVKMTDEERDEIQQLLLAY